MNEHESIVVRHTEAKIKHQETVDNSLAKLRAKEKTLLDEENALTNMVKQVNELFALISKLTGLELAVTLDNKVTHVNGEELREYVEQVLGLTEGLDILTYINDEKYIESRDGATPITDLSNDKLVHNVTWYVNWLIKGLRDLQVELEAQKGWLGRFNIIRSLRTDKAVVTLTGLTNINIQKYIETAE